jgi:alpha-beta hydrolase superfamily lysophospholipase
MANYRELDITLGDGYAAYSRYWPVENCRAAALHIHGIQSHCGWYTATAQRLADSGVAVLQPDRRGSGRNAQARGHAESAQQLIDDALICARRLSELAGVSRVHLIGVSWGGKLAAAMHATEPELTASLALVAPGIHPIIDVSAAEKFRIGWSMVSAPEKHFDIPLNDPELFTSKPEWIRFLVEDEYQIHQATAGFFLASRRMDKIVARLRQSPPAPVHLFLAGEERIIDNQRTRDFIADLPWSHRHVTTYPHSRHTFEFGDDCEAFLGDLTRWVISPESYEARA